MQQTIRVYLAAFILIGAAILIGWSSASTARTPNSSAELSVRTDRPDYSLGESISLNFTIANHTGAVVELAPPNVRTGTIKVLISSDNVSYREYSGPGWGKSNYGKRTITLDPGKQSRTEATVLFNKARPTSHLTPLYSERIKTESIDTCFAIAQPGQYWIRATYSDLKVKLESEPISITVLPAGVHDVAAWEKVRSNDAIAYFLHTGDISSTFENVVEQGFIDHLKQIRGDHPNSHFARTIDQKLNRREQILDSLKNDDVTSR